MERCEVLIVGGGPAGSTCAWALGRLGLEVTLMDRQTFPRDKVCAGWITPQVLASLELDPAEYGAGRVIQPITGFRVGRIGAKAREIRYRDVVSYGIRRCEFDHYLLRRSGARLRLGEPLERLERVGTDWVANGALRAPMLVGAAGHACPVARHLGGSLGHGVPVVAAREAEIPLDPGSDCPVAGDTPELYFCRDLQGYGWCFRKGGWLNVGLGREDGRDIPGHLRAFCARLREQGRIPDLPDKAFKGHAYLLHGRGGRPLTADGALLVGDAAGLAYPQSGEGIRPAVASGLLAARVIAEAGGDYRRERLAAYPRRLAEGLGLPSSRPQPLSPGLAALAGRLVLGNRTLIRALVLDRWFLHRGDAALTATR